MPVGNLGKVIAAKEEKKRLKENQSKQSRQQSKESADERWQWQDKQDHFNSWIFQKYDVDENGTLEKDEFRQLMQDMNGGRQVPDKDVDDLMVLCNKAKDSSISKEELLLAIKIWNDQLKTLPKVQPLVSQYVVGQGRLDKAQIKNLLQALNDGIAVADDEVSQVMENAKLLGDGTIARLDLEKAIVFWYHRPGSPTAVANLGKVMAAKKSQKKSKQSDVGTARQKAMASSTPLQDKQDNFKKDILQNYDADGNGVLDKDELKKLMIDMNDGKEVADADVDDLMVLCDKTKEGSINKDELLFAIKMWSDHLKTLPKLEPLMFKYGMHQTSKLDKNQLKKLLEALNDGIAVTDDEVSWVMENAGQLGNGHIRRLELEKAITLWYNHIEHKDKDAGGPGRDKKACCNIL